MDVDVVGSGRTLEPEEEMVLVGGGEDAWRARRRFMGRAGFD